MEMFPSRLSSETKSPGEKEVFKRFAECKTLDFWIVLHSLAMKQDFLDGETEADFVVLAPGIGILCLEIKACNSVKYDGTYWQLGNKTETRGPFKQADNAKWRLLKELEQAGIPKGQVPVFSGVWFTEISAKDIPQSIERYSDQTLCAEDLDGSIAETITKFMKTGRSRLSASFPPGAPSPETLQAAVNRLRPRFEATQHPPRLEKQIKDFTDHALEIQLVTYAATQEHRAVVIDALAGTGKTFLACQFARHAALRDEKVLFICHNRLLADFLKRNLAEFLNVTVTTMTGLLWDLADIQNEDLRFADLESSWWTVDLPKLALASIAREGLENEYDSIVVDEAQDLGHKSWLEILDVLLDGGFANCKKALVVGDFSNQDLFVDGTKAKQIFEEQLVSPISYSQAFQVNCRNPFRVGLWLAHEIDMTPTWNDFRRQDTTGRPLIIHDVYSDSDIEKAAENEIRKQIKKYPADQVVVLSAQAHRLKEFMQGADISACHVKESIKDRVRYGSPFEFKGLEALCVILVEFMQDNPKIRETFYVSSTRTLGDFSAIISKKKLDSIRKAAHD